MDRDNDDSLLKLAFSIAGNGDVSYGTQDDSAITEDKVADVFSQQLPPNASDPQSVHSLIATQMAQLSVTDREQVYMDVHGIPEYAQETPELIEQSLLELQQEIDLLPDKRAYNIASQLDSKYVQDRDFRLAFLRCERFNCPKAAIRIIRHFQMKLDLFGMDKLAMDIVQDDLNAEDMGALYASFGRFLNGFDRGGRIINLIFSVPKVHKTDAVLRRGFYSIMTAFRNEEIQRRGAVTVYLAFGDFKHTFGDNSDLKWKYPKLNEGSPMRISALHLCYNDEAWKKRVIAQSAGLNKDAQVRVRFVQGTVPECLQHLRGHGIDPACIPVNAHGEMTDLLEERRRLEAQRKYERFNCTPRNTIYVPFSLDVLLGKGCPFQNHPGNKRLRQLVDAYTKRYDKAQKGDKKAIAQEVVDAIKHSGGYFLKQDGNKWIRVDNEVARVKVSATFRTQRWIAKS
mmetsp:Transcript_12367/g.29440  ORF Transcript_12367/g.29440 Transcript_12367/m.29440 type:complete len:456 (+) Transcript_12367:38-1405(+)